jgi:hypothetical protein
MVYTGVEVTACSRIYSDGVKTSSTTCIPHWLTLEMDFDVLLM